MPLGCVNFSDPLQFLPITKSYRPYLECFVNLQKWWTPESPFHFGLHSEGKGFFWSDLSRIFFHAMKEEQLGLPADPCLPPKMEKCHHRLLKMILFKIGVVSNWKNQIIFTYGSRRVIVPILIITIFDFIVWIISKISSFSFFVAEIVIHIWRHEATCQLTNILLQKRQPYWKYSL